VSEIKTQLSRNPIDIPIVHTLYEVYRELHKLILKFPKSERYSLGQTSGTRLLEMLEHALTAAGTSNSTVKREHLTTASTKLDILRLLIRLAKDCNCLTHDSYLTIEARLHETGRMLGGWIKSMG
jgi:HEPN domain-containing protein